MGSKSERRKQRRDQKRKAKRKEKQAHARGRQTELLKQGLPPVASIARHRERLAQQVPRSWTGERPEDAAIFDDSALESLPAELAEQVSLIRQALQEATSRSGDEALKRVAGIPRSSPLSDWRLFLRGLVDWENGETDAASQAWMRLDAERRPGRIAIAMMLALRSDLEQLSPSEPAAPNVDAEAGQPAAPWNRYDEQLLYHAKLLRRVRFDRRALTVAEAGLKAPEESEELRLGLKKIGWLKEFVKEYSDVEPELTAALCDAARRRAFSQEFADVFDRVLKLHPGPRHDPRNNLLTFHYYRRFGADRAAQKKSEAALANYLKRDLPGNEKLPEPLRRAIASQIHLNEAEELMHPPRIGGMFSMLFAPAIDEAGIRKHLDSAIEEAPWNRLAYEVYVDWLESQLDEERLEKWARQELEDELSDVMHRWSCGCPDDVKPRLWLVDELLENEELEEAEPHVEFLAGVRHDDPLVRATPWKWQLLDAMRLCRRKAWLDEVPGRLDEAERLWPAWLSRQWLPYLRAAYLLRCGDRDAFEAERQRICEESGLARDSLPDACMMLAAAQRMRVPAPDLKPLRAPVDAAVNNRDRLPIDELIDAGGFFWDLLRVNLLYPAYRMHGSKFGQELLKRWEAKPGRFRDSIGDDRVQRAMLWSSEFHFWSDESDLGWPKIFDALGREPSPVYIAARVNGFLKLRIQWAYAKYERYIRPLREAAPLQRDAYFRYWFAALAEEMEETAGQVSRRDSFPFRMFGGMAFNGNEADYDDDNDDDDDDDDDFEDDEDSYPDDVTAELGFDPRCDCPKCRAARLAYEASR